MAKLQWNKMNTEIRTTLGEFAVAVWELADKKALHSKRLKGLNSCLETTVADLNKVLSGETKGVLKSQADLEADKTKFEKDIEEAKKVEKALEDEIKERQKKAYTLVPETLYKAYTNRIEDSDAYDKAIGSWLDSVGVAQTGAGIRILASIIGDKETNGKKVVKNADSMGLDNVKSEAYARMFLKGVCREMIKAGVLKTDAYKFEYVDEKKNN